MPVALIQFASRLNLDLPDAIAFTIEFGAQAMRPGLERVGRRQFGIERPHGGFPIRARINACDRFPSHQSCLA